MEKIKAFKNAVFGGYNREEVDRYLSESESEAALLKASYEEKLAGLNAEAQAARSDHEVSMKELKLRTEELEQAREKIKALESSLAEKTEKEEALTAKVAELQRSAETMSKALADHAEEKAAADAQLARYEKAVKVMDGQASSLRDRENDYKDEIDTLQARLADMEMTLAHLKKENKDLTAGAAGDPETTENEASSETSVKTPELTQTEEGYQVVRQVLSDARKNADLIEKEAREKADTILSEAKKEAESIRHDLPQVIDRDLEEKGIQLIAAKYTMEDYSGQLKGLQDQMDTLQGHLRRMIEGMPSRVDDYWKGEQYARLREVSEKNGQAYILGEELDPDVTLQEEATKV